MIDVIRQLLGRRPFLPFFIVTSGGNRYRVTSNEHAALSPPPHRVTVWFDEGGGVMIPGLHIASVEQEPAHAA